MKKMIKVIVVICVISLPTFLFGQTATSKYSVNGKIVDDKNATNYHLEFTNISYDGNIKIVNFYITNINDENQLKNIYNSLVAIPSVLSVNIDNEKYCTIKMTKNILPETILEKLKANSADFNYKDIVKIENEKSITKVQPFVFKAVKDYENNKRIAYFTIEGIESAEQSAFLQREMKEISKIYKFQIYDKASFNKFMIECDSSLDETYLYTKINEILSK